MVATEGVEHHAVDAVAVASPDFCSHLVGFGDDGKRVEYLVVDAVSYSHLTLPTIYSV